MIRARRRRKLKAHWQFTHLRRVPCRSTAGGRRRRKIKGASFTLAVHTSSTCSLSFDRSHAAPTKIEGPSFTLALHTSSTCSSSFDRSQAAPTKIEGASFTLALHTSSTCSLSFDRSKVRQRELETRHSRRSYSNLRSGVAGNGLYMAGRLSASSSVARTATTATVNQAFSSQHAMRNDTAIGRQACFSSHGFRKTRRFIHRCTRLRRRPAGVVKPANVDDSNSH